MPESEKFNAWCSQHGCHPEQCWDKHVQVPLTKAKSREEEITSIAQQHLKKQKEQRERADVNPANAQHGGGTQTDEDSRQVPTDSRP